MKPTLELVRGNVRDGHVVVSRHAAAQLKQRGIALDEALAAATRGEVIEDYPDDVQGAAVLLLHQGDRGAVHAVWRIEAATAGPAHLVTAYRPTPADWHDGFRTRRGVSRG